MEALENTNHASILCFFDSLGAIWQISNHESASIRVLTHRHPLSAWFFSFHVYPLSHLEGNTEMSMVLFSFSAVSNSKQSKYFASLDSIHDIAPASPEPSTQSSSTAPLNRAGSIDSVLVDQPQIRANRRADSVDRYPLSRASYIEATKTIEPRTTATVDRGRTHEKKPTLR